jgi:hypothetical protein
VRIQRVMTDNGGAYISCSFRDACKRLLHPTPAHQALYPAYQRQGGALHPNLPPGVGLR